MECFGIIKKPVATIYGEAGKTREDEKGCLSTISDEGLYGMSCRVLSREGIWSYVITYYGYAGFVETENLKLCTEKEIKEYLAKPLAVISGRQVDVLSLPKVQGVPFMTLGTGCIVELAEPEKEAQKMENGWCKIRLLSGEEGYIPWRFVEKKWFTEDYLWKKPEEVLTNLKEVSKRSREAVGGQADFSLQILLEKYYKGDEEAFRNHLEATAKEYLGTQYRWGGRSMEGIDCSGLVSMAYMRSGVIAYRDAAIAAGYALERIPVDFVEEDGQRVFSLENLESGVMKKGDALYFPGHIAMYLGEGKYIHSTAKAGSNGVVINSLRPEDENYRKDLHGSLYAVAGVRKK